MLAHAQTVYYAETESETLSVLSSGALFNE